MKDINYILPALQQQGLNDKEIELYLRSLQMGPQKASKLCQYTKINRNTAQYTCQQLVKKRLMTVYSEKNSFVFSPEPPEKLLLLREEERKVFENKSKGLKKAVEYIKATTNQEVESPTVKYYQGPQGIIDMYEDTLQSKEPLYAATRIEPNALPEVNEYIQKRYTPERMKNKNPAWVLFNNNEASKNYRKNDSKVNRISLLIPTESFPLDTCLHIYGNKVAFFSFKKNDATGIIIENTPIKDTMMSLFKLSWNMARTLPENHPYRDTQI